MPSWSVSSDRGGVAAGRDVVAHLINTGDYATFFTGSYQPLTEVFQDASPIFTRVDVERFVGREWLTTALDRFLLEEDSGYFLIEAKAGLGKTAFLAHLVRTRGWFHHFIELTPGDAGIDAARKNLAAQLIRAFELHDGGGEAVVSTQAANSPDFLGRIFQQAAHRLRAHERVVIVVDALDEAAIRAGENVVGLPRALPAGVYVVASKRPVDVPLRVDTRRVVLLEAQSADNLRDIRTFLKAFAARRADSNAGKPVDDLVDVLTRKSRGVWVYLNYVVAAIEQSDARHQEYDFDRLPEGLWRYYADYWLTWSQDNRDWYRLQLPALAVLAAAEEAVSLTGLCAFAGLTGLESEVLAMLNGGWRPFITVVRVAGLERRYAPYHASLREFLSGRFDRGDLLELEQDFVDDLSATTQATHGAIADKFLTSWGGLDGGLPQLGQAQSGDPQQAYGLAHVARHLASAHRRADVYRLITRRWMDAKVTATQTPSAFAEDVDLAVQLATTETPVNVIQQVRCTLIQGLVHSIVSTAPPTILGVLAGCGHEDKAFGYASLLKSLQTNSGAAAGYLSIGRRLAQLGDTTGAMRAFLAVEVSAPQVDVLAELASALSVAGESVKSANLAERALCALTASGANPAVAQVAAVVHQLIQGGFLTQARSALAAVESSSWLSEHTLMVAAVELMRAAATSGDVTTALALSQMLPSPWGSVPALADLTHTVHRLGLGHDAVGRVVESLTTAVMSMGEAEWEVWPLRAHLAVALTVTGRREAGDRLAVQVMDGAARHADPVERAWSLAGVCRIFAAAGDFERAESTAQGIIGPDGDEDSVQGTSALALGRAFAGLARAHARAGAADQALALLAKSERLAQTRAPGGGYISAYALPELPDRDPWDGDRIDVLVALAGHGQEERVRSELAGSGDGQVLASAVVSSLAAANELELAQMIARELDVSLWAQAALADALMDAGRRDDAQRLAEAVLIVAGEQATRPDLQVAADLALTVASSSEQEPAARLLGWLLGRLDEADAAAPVLARVVEVMLALDQPEGAVSIARRLPRSASVGLVAGMVESFVTAGHGSLAAELALQISPLTSSEMVSGRLNEMPLPRLAAAMLGIGRPEVAATLVTRALEEAQSLDLSELASARARSMEAYLVLGQPDDAVALTVQTVNPWYEAPSIAQVSVYLANHGQKELTRQVGEVAIRAVRSMGNSWAAGGTARSITETFAGAGLLDLAADAVPLVNAHPDHSFALCAYAQALGRAGRVDEGKEAARQAVREAKPAYTAALIAGALTLNGLGEAAEAEILIGEAIASAAANPAADLRVSALSDIAIQLLDGEFIARGVNCASQIDVTGALRPSFKARALLAAARAVAAKHEVSQAADLVAQARAVAEAPSAPGWDERYGARLLWSVAGAYQNLGRLDDALDVWQTSVTKARRNSGLAGVLEMIGLGRSLLLEVNSLLLGGVVDTILDVYESWLDQP